MQKKLKEWKTKSGHAGDTKEKCNLDYVMDECESLSKQIKEVEMLMVTCAKCEKDVAIEEAAKFQIKDERLPLCQEHYRELLLYVSKWFEK